MEPRKSYKVAGNSLKVTLVLNRSINFGRVLHDDFSDVVRNERRGLLRLGVSFDAQGERGGACRGGGGARRRGEPVHGPMQAAEGALTHRYPCRRMAFFEKDGSVCLCKSETTMRAASTDQSG